jgi:signal transduction histidine kinase
VSRFLPRSLVAQVALLIGAALLVAQLANFALVLNEREKLSLAQNLGPAISRYASVAADVVQAAPEFRGAVLEDASRRGAHFRLEAVSAVAPGEARDAEVEARALRAMAEAGVRPGEVRATSRAEARRGGGGDAQRLILASRFAGGGWLNGVLATPRPDPYLVGRLAAATAFLYLIVLGASLLVAWRLVRPLRALTEAARAFGGRDEPVRVDPKGPADLRRAIEAFNAMNRRLVGLLDEKDRMLGAIGHDLRTPLASLRIRLEAEDLEPERQRMTEIVEETGAVLEDILVLARTGRSREATQATDLAALVETIAKEFREGGGEVAVEEGDRPVLAVQPVLLRRAVRNLVDNALKHGGSARLSVRRSSEGIAIAVADRGPGLPDDQLERVLAPFYRGEASRNRQTGGTGLGLPIARAVAEAHGGTLRLENGHPGLVATLVLPEVEDRGQSI